MAAAAAAAREGGARRQLLKHSLGARRQVLKRSSRRTFGTRYDPPALFNMLLSFISVFVPSISFVLAAAYKSGGRRYFPKRSHGVTRRILKRSSGPAHMDEDGASFQQAPETPYDLPIWYENRASSQQAPGAPYDRPPYAVRGLLWGCHQAPMRREGSILVDSSGSKFLFFADDSSFNPISSTFDSVASSFDPMDVDGY